MIPATEITVYEIYWKKKDGLEDLTLASKKQRIEIKEFSVNGGERQK